MTESLSLHPRADMPLSPSAEMLPRRFVLRIAHGDILNADADCLVVNHYAGSTVTGAAADVDHQVNNAIARIAARGELNSPSGRITFVPARRSPMIADVVAVLSMGEYETFTKQALNLPGTNESIIDSLQRFGRSMAIACCEAEQRDVATVAHGAGETSAIPPELVARHLVYGYWQGLQQSGQSGLTYTLTLVEQDAAKCRRLVEGVRQVADDDLAGGLRMFRFGQCADQTEADGSPTPGYAWMAELDAMPDDPNLPPKHMRLGAFMLKSDLLKLTAFSYGGADQAIWDSYQAKIIQSARDRLRVFNTLVPPRLHKLHAIAQGDDAAAAAQAAADIRQLHTEVELRVRSIGAVLFNQIFNPNTTAGLRAELNEPAAQHLLLRLDEQTVAIPWELMFDEREILGLDREIGRQMELPSVVRNYMLNGANQDGTLRILLISNPLGDLPRVEEEARRIVDRLHRRSRVRVQVTHIHGADATTTGVISRADEDGYDVLHFAGHAVIDPLNPGKSGLVLAKGDVLTVEAISRITAPPPLVFFNACETANAHLPIPVANLAEMHELGLLENDEWYGHLTAGGNGSNGKHSNGSGGNGAGQSGAGTMPGNQPSLAEEEIVTSFFSHLPASMVTTLLRAGITNFIGTTWPVDDSTASEFAVNVYDQLASGHTVGNAMQLARKAVIKKMGFGYLGWASYVLYGAPWNRIV